MVTLRTVSFNHINHLTRTHSQSRDSTYSEEVSQALALVVTRRLRQLLWRHALDLFVPIWPHNDPGELNSTAFAAVRIGGSCERVREDSTQKRSKGAAVLYGELRKIL